LIVEQNKERTGRQMAARCIKRISTELNVEKHKRLSDFIIAFNHERNHWLLELQKPENWIFIAKPRALRDEMTKQKYVNKYGLQARAWKQALMDSADMMNRYWLALLVNIRSDVAKNTQFTIEQKHFANYILADNFGLYLRLFDLIEAEKLIEAKKIKIDRESKLKVQRFLRRKVKKYRKKYPKIKLFRSASFDTGTYSLYEHKGCQYIGLSSKIANNRIKVPLLGYLNTSRADLGIIKAIINPHDTTIEIHFAQKLKKVATPTKDAEIIGLDTGYTEVFFDDEGDSYGEGFGEVLTETTTYLTDKDAKRNQLREIRNKHLEKGNFKKAHNIQKFNLGRKKYDDKLRKSRATAERLINQAINEITEDSTNKILVTENLKHAFKYDKGRKVNNLFSRWLRGTVSKRLDFKACAEGFGTTTVNASYTSQTCPSCGYPHRDNRKGDAFECLKCGHEGHSDAVAAMNIRSRYFDTEITQTMPTKRVREILMERFQRGSESGSNTTDSLPQDSSENYPQLESEEKLGCVHLNTF